MELFNDDELDLDALTHTEDSVVAIPVVPGRVVHIDADFLAYQVSYDDTKTFEEMQHNCDEIIDRLVKLSGAEHHKLYLTPQGSNKGGRYELALLKEYQGNRKEKPKPKMLHHVRNWLRDHRDAIMCLNSEADDGMATAQYKTVDKNLSIIASKDKDLLMVPGKNLDWSTGEITDTAEDSFGWIELDCSGKQKKVRGRGWKYFWAQMLTGDSADNISGLPKVCLPEYKKPKACGPVLAFELLEPCKTNQEAFELVKSLYNLYGETIGFTNYRDDTPVDWRDAMVSEACLLWMRRNDDVYDVLKWMRNYCL